MHTAQSLNDHLKAGGAVLIGTYGRSTVYTAKHAGAFTQRGDELHVKRGKSTDCLGKGHMLYVAIRLGHPRGD